MILNRWRHFLAFAFILTSVKVFAVPDHFEYMITVDDPTTSTVTGESFNRIFSEITSRNQDAIDNFYLPVVYAPDWIRPYFTAYVAKKNDFMELGFWGGMARIPGMNDDGVALIVCHEVAHLIGGNPMFTHPLYNDLTSENQADYYAAKVCLKDYFKSLPDTLEYLEKDIHPVPARACRERYQSDLDTAVCLRTANAVEGFTHVLRHLKEDYGPLSFDSMDETEAQATITDDYASNQCRLDNFMAGAYGLSRPSCWFKN